MKRFIALTFGLLGWAWYAMSGGSEFTAGTNGIDLPAMVRTAEAEPLAETAPEVTRGSTASLTDVGPAESQAAVIQAAARPAEAPVIDVALAATPAAPIAASFEPESAAPQSASDPAPRAPAADLRTVTGSRVNLRYGPGTSYSVVGQLIEGDRVEVLSDPGDGWVKLQVEDGGSPGWMYDAYLAAAAD